MNRVRIAQIGIGHAHAPSNFRSFVAQKDLFEVKGFCLCEGDEEKYAHQREIYDVVPRLSLETILNDPELDAVAIEAEEMYDTRYALMAAERGFHIFMDKPGGISQRDFEKLVSVIKKKKLAFHLGYMYRENPAWLEALEMVRSGALGEIYSVEAHMDCYNTLELRQWLTNFPGGQLYFLGCHLIDLILTIQGVPDRIIPLSVPTGLEGAQGEDFGMAVFQYPHGVSFVKTCAREPGGFMRRQLVICGSRGTVEIRPLEIYVPPVGRCDQMTRIRTTWADDPAGWTAQGKEKELGPFNRYDGMTAAFAREVRGESVNPYSCDYEVMLHRILLEACGLPREEA